MSIRLIAHRGASAHAPANTPEAVTAVAAHGGRRHRLAASVDPVESTDPSSEHAGGTRTFTDDDPAGGAEHRPDLDHIGRQLADVEAALQRLDAGTYWTDEVTAEPIADHLLESDPLARRASP